MQRVTTVCSIPVVAKDLQVIVAGKKCYKTYSQELLQNKMFFSHSANAIACSRLSQATGRLGLKRF